MNISLYNLCKGESFKFSATLIVFIKKSTMTGMIRKLVKEWEKVVRLSRAYGVRRRGGFS